LRAKRKDQPQSKDPYQLFSRFGLGKAF